jgi:hypothetical protein
MKTKTVKAKDLWIDDKLTNLRKIDEFTVSRYRQAYRNGANMPPLIIQAGNNNRVISGNHRLTAILEEYGGEQDVEIIEKSLESEKEVLKLFAQENLTHGKPLEGFARKKIIAEILKENEPASEVAKLFNISVKRIEQLHEEMVEVQIGKNKTELRPSKTGFEPEKPITKDQYETHEKKDKGISVISLANQLIRWMEGDHIKTDEKNMDALRNLQKSLNKYMK